MEEEELSNSEVLRIIREHIAKLNDVSKRIQSSEYWKTIEQRWLNSEYPHQPQLSHPKEYFRGAGIKIFKSYPTQYTEEGKDWAVALLLRDKNFWVLSFVFALQFSAMMAVLSHITLYASEKGWASQAALIFSMYAIPAMLSKVTFGWLVEKKLDPRIAVSISLLLQGLGIILITSANTPYQLAAIIALFGFGGGAALPLSNILFAKAYTPKSFGRARGLAQPVIALFQAGGTPLAALLYQSNGDYRVAFMLLASLLCVAVVLIWFLKLTEQVPKEI